MTYTNLFFKSNSETSTPNQVTSTTYTEITGSRVDVNKVSTSSDLYYYFSFSTCPYNSEKARLHIKLQRSSDNFSSNIVDVPNCNYNFSTDTGGGTDHLYKNNNIFFIVQNTGNDSLRLVIRSYGSNTRSYLHFTPHFDGALDHNNKYYYPTLIVKELQ